MFPQLPNRPHTVIHISGSPHCEFSVSCLHCVKNFTSVCRRQRSTFINVNVYQAHTKENEASVFLFYFHIHTWFTISSVRLQANWFCLNLNFYVVFCIFIFLSSPFLQMHVCNFCNGKVFTVCNFFVCFCMWAYESPDEGKGKMGGKKRSSQLRWQDNFTLQEDCCLWYTSIYLLYILFLRGRWGEMAIKCYVSCPSEMEHGTNLAATQKPSHFSPSHWVNVLFVFKQGAWASGDMLHSPLRHFTTAEVESSLGDKIGERKTPW